MAMIPMSVLVRHASALLIGKRTTRPRCDSGRPGKNGTRYSRVTQLLDTAVSCWWVEIDVRSNQGETAAVSSSGHHLQGQH